jgi:hypothetical protein
VLDDQLDVAAVGQHSNVVQRIAIHQQQVSSCTNSKLAKLTLQSATHTASSRLRPKTTQQRKQRHQPTLGADLELPLFSNLMQVIAAPYRTCRQGASNAKRYLACTCYLNAVKMQAVAIMHMCKYCAPAS